MKLAEIFDPNNIHHQKMMNDIDHFTASPRLNLKHDTIEFLKSTRRSKTHDMTLYRVLFSYNLQETAKALGVSKLSKGEHVTHSSKRVTSWSTSYRIVSEMANENDDLGDFAIILKATIPAKSIVLDTDDLSSSDKEHIKLFVQKEVIVDAGTYRVIVLDIIDNT